MTTTAFCQFSTQTSPGTLAKLRPKAQLSASRGLKRKPFVLYKTPQPTRSLIPHISDLPISAPKR